MTHLLTPEQQQIVRSTARRLRVQAYAGTGKTATLVAYAQARPDQRILYLAFNKPIQREAARRFPRHVTCLTTHALAYRHIGRAFQDAGRLGSLGASDLMDRFDLAPVDARRVLDTLESFLRSADPRPSGRHLPPDLIEADRTPVVRLAAWAWEAMQARDGDLPMTHDGYLKLYQLGRPDLSQTFDLLLFDEAQDANEVTLDLIGQQRLPQVVVGDTHQSIYAFRGAVDALSRFEADETLRLTQSFRFGPGAAAVATALLAGLKGESVPVVGQPDRETVFEVDRNRPYTVIARTNATVFAEAVALLGTTRFHLIGGVASYPFDRLVDVHHLLSGQPGAVRDGFLKRQRTASRLEAYAAEVDDKELLMLLKVARDHGAQTPDLVRRLQAEATADAQDAQVCLTTAHRAKGLEFEQVVLADDFPSFISDEGLAQRADTPERVQELNLLYVAVTRARHAIELNRQALELCDQLVCEGYRAPEIQPFRQAAQPAPPTERQQIEQAILVEGLLTLPEIARHLGRPEEEVAGLIARLITRGQLAARLFQRESAIEAKLRAHPPTKVCEFL